jgi:RNA recognition motif-containing protein
LANKQNQYIFLFFYLRYSMSKNIYVGNLAYSVTEDSLRKLFEAYGNVTTVKVVTDKFTGSSRGFGFVEMPNNEEADRAIAELNGKDFEGRKAIVNESRPRENNGGGNDFRSSSPRRDGGRDGGRNNRWS